MICPNCGAQIEENYRFCNKCGMSVDEDAVPPVQSTVTEVRPELPMKWYNFLVWVMFTLGPVITIISGIGTIAGTRHYMGSNISSQDVYSVFTELKPLDITLGISAILLAIFAFYIRSRLVAYRKDAPKLLTVYYSIELAINLVFEAIYIIVFNSYVTFAFSDIASAFASDVGGTIIKVAILIPVNIAYFKKRKHLFVN